MLIKTFTCTELQRGSYTNGRVLLNNCDGNEAKKMDECIITQHKWNHVIEEKKLQQLSKINSKHEVAYEIIDPTHSVVLR